MIKQWDPSVHISLRPVYSNQQEDDLQSVPPYSGYNSKNYEEGNSYNTNYRNQPYLQTNRYETTSYRSEYPQGEHEPENIFSTSSLYPYTDPYNQNRRDSYQQQPTSVRGSFEPKQGLSIYSGGSQNEGFRQSQDYGKVRDSNQYGSSDQRFSQNFNRSSDYRNKQISDGNSRLVMKFTI